jgi:hypothetical protein
MHPPAAGGERSLEAAACRTSFGGYPQTILSKIWSTITAKASILVSALLVSSVRASSVGLVQVAVDTEHHLIVAHEVTNVGNDRRISQTLPARPKRLSGSRSLRSSPTVLDRCVSYMPNQGQVHDGQRASHHAVGARGGCRGRAAKVRQKSGRHAHAP